MRKKYIYFVSYSYTKGKLSGFGNCENRRTHKIKNQNDLNETMESIKRDYGFDTVIILYYRKF